MSFAIRKKTAELLDARDVRLCIASGCPCHGSVDTTSSGRYTCRYHAFAESHLWPRITDGLHSHDWLIGFMGDIDGKARKGWREYATAFWERAEPEMVPKPTESREMYAYRLHLSLAARVGAGPAAPDRIKPQGDGMSKRGGNMADALHFAEAA